jgi:alkylation response protein AidB-like acyl-CoA dehydrogenase
VFALEGVDRRGLALLRFRCRHAVSTRLARDLHPGQGRPRAEVSMLFQLTEEQRLVQETVREFARAEIAPQAAVIDRTREFPIATYRRCGELNLTGMMVSEAYGGAGMDSISYAIAIEEISRACASTGVILSVNNSLYCDPIERLGTAAQKERWLTPFARGHKLGCYCLTEPHSGSDASALRTIARREGSGWIVQGNKVFVTNGVAADAAIVYATTDPARGHRSVCAFVIDRDTPGYSIGKHETKMGITASGSVEIVLDGVRLGPEGLLGAEGEGFKIALSTLDGGRVGIAAQAVGIAQAALDHAAAYAKERTAFGRPIAELQAIQFKLADMAVRIEAARQLTYRAAALKDAQRRFTKEAAMAKLYASAVAVDASREAVQIFGGYGYINEYPVERLYRDAKITEIYEGTSEIQRLVIAANLLKEA